MRRVSIATLEYRVTAKRIDQSGSEATTKEASVTLDTSMAGRSDAFNPAELLLAAISACIIKGIERVSPMLNFQFSGVDIKLRGERQDTPPMMALIEYELIVATDETDQRLELLHTNVQKYGTIFNTIAKATTIRGSIKRATA